MTGNAPAFTRFCSTLCLLLLTLAFPAESLRAQEKGGIVTGQLIDQSGGLLPHVNLLITNKTTGRVTTLTTDGAGMYRAELDPGPYSVRFEMSGFAPQEVPDVEVLLGRTFNVNATMKVGDMSEAVQVTAETSPLIDKGSTAIAHNVTAAELDRLPKARSFQGIALTAPSVNQGDIEGGFQVNGASGAENTFTVDGVVTNSVINGASRQNTVFEYIQEVQVKTTGIPAEYRGALGGVIGAVTKAGGNRVHGEGHYHFQGSALAGSPVKRLVLSPIDDKTVSYVQDRKSPEKQSEIGGSIGGPIRRDHLWYFGSYSPRFNRRTNAYEFSSGTEQGSVKRSTDLAQIFGKLSFGSKQLSASGTALYTPNTTKGTLSAFNGVGPNFVSSSMAASTPNLARGYKQTQTSTTGNLDFILSSSACATVRGGYFYDNYGDTGIPQTTNYMYQNASTNSPVPLPAALQGPAQTENTPRAQIATFDKTKHRFFNVDYQQTFQAGGRHTLKGGVGYQHTTNDVNLAYPGGYVDIFFGQSFVFSGVNRGAGAAGYYAVSNRGTIGRAGAGIVTLFLQDQWQASDRLTVNLGVRTESEKVPAFRGGVKNAFDFGFKDKLAPRLGAAYDVNGDGKVKLFGSWGRYYDWTKYGIARGSFGGDVWCISYRALDDPRSIPSLNLKNMPGADLWTVPGSCRDRRVPSLNAIDPDIKPMSQDSSSAGVDLQLNPRSVLAIHYVHNSLRRAIEDIGFLDTSGNEGYLIGNPGEGQAKVQFSSGRTPAGQPIPKPVRQYDALQIGIDRRFAGSWYGSANYTWSRLYGNYAGLSSSDEIRTPTTGVSSATAQQQAGSTFREGGNVNRAYDIDELLWDSHGNIDPKGLLATDRPHVVKLFGSYTAPFGTTFGGFQYAGSGTPITTYLETSNQTEVFVNGRGDMGRTPFLTQTDILVSHDLKMSGSKTVRLELNVLNVFNQKTARHIFNAYNRGAGVARAASAASLASIDLTKGYDYKALVAATVDGQAAIGALDPRYGMQDLFNPPLQAYVTAKFIF